MKKVGIIGGGIVGSVAAFYLARAGYDVTLFDDGTGQATKAAVGIICPWVSQRRNKWWYQLVDDGSIFYHQLLRDIPNSQFYEPSGALLVNESRLDKMYDLALSRRHSQSIMGHIEILDEAACTARLPFGSLAKRALYIEGAARVDGALLVSTLQAEAMNFGMKRVNAKVSFEQKDSCYRVMDEDFDHLILAAGAWLPDLLPQYEVDVRPQKGQLIEFHHHVEAKNYPLYIPKGEIDLLYKKDGTVVVGASHDDESGFDLGEDGAMSRHMQSLASSHLPSLAHQPIDSVRIGTRAYTSDFLPFYGVVSGLEHCYAASGLGSSGLTSGPIIGYRLAQQIQGLQPVTFTDDYIRPL